MSTRVYLSKHTYQTPHEEDTPVCLRIQRSRATVKELHSRLQHAYQRDDVRLVRRLTALLDLLVHQVPVEVLSERGGRSPSCLSHWRQALLLRGMDSLVSRHGGGRPEQLPPTQRQRFVALLAAGPLVVGLATAWWHSVLIRGLIWRECGVLSNRHAVCTLLHTLGVSFQQARCVSDHLDAATRVAWRPDQGPALVRAAKRGTGVSRFADEASLAQGGSVRYPWARRGHQPEVPPSGQRKGDKVFGAIEYFSGRVCSQGIAGRFNSDSSQAFVPMSMAQTPEPWCLLHDGARDHTRASTTAFLAAHTARLTEDPFPSYAPDDTPIASLWKKTKQRATHNKYCKECAELTVSVEKALAYCATHPDTVLGLCGRYCEESGLALQQVA